MFLTHVRLHQYAPIYAHGQRLAQGFLVLFRPDAQRHELAIGDGALFFESYAFLDRDLTEGIDA